MRFYERQFITRDIVNQRFVKNFETLLTDYFNSKKLQNYGIPSVGYLAGQLNLLPNYFGDLIKKETGYFAQEYIHIKLIEVAKELVFDYDKSVSQIANELGFKYPQHFSRLFKKRVGYSSSEFRQLN